MESLSDDEPIARIRAFLPHVASLVEAKEFKDERPALPTEAVGRLSDAELEQLAEIYAATLLHRTRTDGAKSAEPEREADEQAIEYLNRLLKHHALEQAKQLRTMREKMLASTSSPTD